MVIPEVECIGTSWIGRVQPPACRQNLIDNAGDWRRGVNDDTATRDAFFCCMQSRNEFLLFRFSAEVSWVQRHALVEPSKQCLKVADLKNKSAVEQINKVGEVSRAAAEEGDCVAVISRCPR